MENVSKSKSVSTDWKISDAAKVARSNRWPSDGIRSLKGVLELELLPAQTPKIALPANELVAYVCNIHHNPGMHSTRCLAMFLNSALDFTIHAPTVQLSKCLAK